MTETPLLIDQVTAAAFMGISVTTFKRRRYSDKDNFPKPVEGFSAKLYWKRSDILKYVESLEYQQPGTDSIAGVINKPTESERRVS